MKKAYAAKVIQRIWRKFKAQRLENVHFDDAKAARSRSNTLEGAGYTYLVKKFAKSRITTKDELEEKDKTDKVAAAKETEKELLISERRRKLQDYIQHVLSPPQPVSTANGANAKLGISLNNQNDELYINRTKELYAATHGNQLLYLHQTSYRLFTLQPIKWTWSR